ncbi:E3 ubiquitin-protein ligase RGLG2-like [Syzygium oleosum]|uniref:E3 ubiquitin-protein ligase RGLG2-like n=1 Tax=Syzygium oleosum TaxID=219896 RepID=UPI0024BBAEAD|nr:E3 ubiquitin-protein ligase RGLG2-like [Syzygium oleosum]XP_030450601.2 E3 ubiquitin-protein ligase RGLG2-like [Syzygium oleosum]XP_030450602.2 E3 ubiquitin-protein ligase RGLG2-like [Syzygium oleosum]XP_056169953.1 E3 ubiquitin-protein ligase RGLG2-like [Syzygium oleosum]XP_056169954.1 E3 ubiquitin-protein ligase RGLG2-like [Syzygium oleosum]
MGAKLSTEDSWGENSNSPHRSTSSPLDSRYEYAQPPLYRQESVSDPSPQMAYPPPQMAYPPPQMAYRPSQQYYPPPQEHGYGGGQARNNRRRLDKRYSRIADSFNSLEEVTEALARAGLESSNLIVGIDFTKSNEWTGAKSFNKRSLHDISNGLNPYEQAISIIGRTLAAFDDDNLIPCFGFGDASTHDQDVFGFFPDDRYCNGFEEVLHRYREIVPHLRLAGPTSFAPIIEMAMTIVEQSGGQYHVLVIIADGQVTRSVDTEQGQLSPQERKTVEAIVEASKLPLSIILVGVGDGPWDTMQDFDDNIPARAFDNFQFVNFTEIMMKNVAPPRKEMEFALSALMEIPSQYKATLELNLLGQKRNVPRRVPLPPPVYGTPSTGLSKPSRPTISQPSVPPYYRDSYLPTTQPSVPPYYRDSYPPTSQPSVPPYYEDYHPTISQPSVPPYPGDSQPTDTAPSAPSSANEDQLCPICFTNVKDMAFGCGHQTCCECGQDLQLCPICRSSIHTRIKLY